jgi:hypothetical protein
MTPDEERARKVHETNKKRDKSGGAFGKIKSAFQKINNKK